MENSRPLVPNFLKKIDRSLLLNSPSVWSTRTHLFLFFSLCFSILLALFSVLLYMDARQMSSVEILCGFTGLICGIGFIFWLIYLLRFNVFKRYGNWITGDGIRTFALFFLNIFVLVLIPFIPTAIESIMANRQFSTTELVNDANEMNIAANKLEYDKLPKFWMSDTLRAVTQKYRLDTNYTTSKKDTVLLSVTPEQDEAGYRRNTTYIPKGELKETLKLKDSIIKINDSVFITYNCPKFQYVANYDMTDNKGNTQLTNMQLYNTYIKNYTIPDRAALLKKMEFFKKKYYVSSKYDSDFSPSDVATDMYDTDGKRTEDISYIEFINKSYYLSSIDDTISRVYSKKEQFSNQYLSYLHFALWFTLITTLLLFIFRHSTIKTFFLSALAAFILAIISGLFIAVGGGSSTSIYSLMIFYFITFAIISFTIVSAKTRTLVQGIALNLFLFALPLMPLIITALYFEIMDFERYNEFERNYVNTAPYYFGAEIIGFALLIILIEPVFKRLYRAWYANAEE
jgi:hypothetical protein